MTNIFIANLYFIYDEHSKKVGPKLIMSLSLFYYWSYQYNSFNVEIIFTLLLEKKDLILSYKSARLILKNSPTSLSCAIWVPLNLLLCSVHKLTLRDLLFKMPETSLLIPTSLWTPPFFSWSNTDIQKKRNREKANLVMLAYGIGYKKIMRCKLRKKEL